jgi:hypothetical protein
MKHNQTIKTMIIFAKKKVAKHGTRLRDRWATALAGEASQKPCVPSRTKGYTALYETSPMVKQIKFVLFTWHIQKLTAFSF